MSRLWFMLMLLTWHIIQPMNSSLMIQQEDMWQAHLAGAMNFIWHKIKTQTKLLYNCNLITWFKDFNWEWQFYLETTSQTPVKFNFESYKESRKSSLNLNLDAIKAQLLYIYAGKYIAECCNTIRWEQSKSEKNWIVTLNKRSGASNEVCYKLMCCSNTYQEIVSHNDFNFVKVENNDEDDFVFVP